MAQQTIPVARLQFEFDFSKREFVLRFESRTHAAAYQALNPEARILEGQPRDVWLPYPPEMSSLRSSSLGMAAIFQNQAAAEKWQRRTCLGGVANFSGDPGVYFKRDWSYTELEERLVSRRSSLKPPPSPSRSNTPINDRVIDMRVDRQRASAKR